MSDENTDIMNFFVPDWFLWLFGSISTLITLGSLAIAALGNSEDVEVAKKILAGYWGSVVALFIIAVVMTFVIKPVLNEIWNVLF